MKGEIKFRRPQDDEEFVEMMESLIRFSRIDPESVPHLMDDLYRKRFDLPIDAIYGQLVSINT
jgi:hypothetical protein